MKNLRRLACKFDLDQSERKSSQVKASARKNWPNGLRLRLARALDIRDRSLLMAWWDGEKCLGGSLEL